MVGWRSGAQVGLETLELTSSEACMDGMVVVVLWCMRVGENLLDRIMYMVEARAYTIRAPL